MEYRKLVRDLIPEIILRKGDKVTSHIADDLEYREALFKKIAEEVAECAAKPSAEEMADILEVLRALANYYGINWETVEDTRLQKAKERGGFTKRIILDSSE